MYSVQIKYRFYKYIVYVKKCNLDQVLDAEYAECKYNAMLILQESNKINNLMLSENTPVIFIKYKKNRWMLILFGDKCNISVVKNVPNVDYIDFEINSYQDCYTMHLLLLMIGKN